MVEAQLARPTPQPFCGVNIMEAVHSPGEGMKLMQKKKTFYPDWNKCFDSHLVQGRRMQVRTCMMMPASLNSRAGLLDLVEYIDRMFLCCFSSSVQMFAFPKTIGIIYFLYLCVDSRLSNSYSH